MAVTPTKLLVGVVLCMTLFNLYSLYSRYDILFPDASPAPSTSVPRPTPGAVHLDGPDWITPVKTEGGKQFTNTPRATEVQSTPLPPKVKAATTTPATTSTAEPTRSSAASSTSADAAPSTTNTPPPPPSPLSSPASKSKTQDDGWLPAPSLEANIFEHKKVCKEVASKTVHDAVFQVRLHTQVKDDEGDWEYKTRKVTLKARETGIFVIDPWNHHWCKEAESRLEHLYKTKMNEYLLKARTVGVQVLFFPHHAMKPYLKWDQYLKTKRVPKLPLPKGELKLHKHPFKCNDCCNDDSVKPKTHKVWTAIHPLISICQDDVINIEPVEVFRWLKHKKIKNLLFLGGATNQCILNRDFGMKHFCYPPYGFKCMLIKDMTETAVGKDSGDNILKPGKRLTPEEAEDLMFDYYERHVVPTILSPDILSYRVDG